VGFSNPITSGGSHGGFAEIDATTGVIAGGDDCCFGGETVPTGAASFAGQETWFAMGLVTPFPPDGFAGIEGHRAGGQVVRALTDVGGTGAGAGTPAVAGGMAYFTRPRGGFLDAIDATGVEGCTDFGSFVNCTPLWSAPVTGSPPVAVSGSTVYTATPGASGGIAAFATGAGVRGPDQQPVWQAAVPGASPVGLTPASAATSVLVGASDGTLRAYAAGGCGAATCSPVWQGVTGGAVGAPVIANGVAFVPSADGHVYAFAAGGCGGATTCDPLWSVATPSAPSDVIVANGRVFVTTDTGDLIAYALPT
jgi:outer membrane protein assembly factor BamB